jgi:hypothetical protein
VKVVAVAVGLLVLWGRVQLEGMVIVEHQPGVERMVSPVEVVGMVVGLLEEMLLLILLLV